MVNKLKFLNINEFKVPGKIALVIFPPLAKFIAVKLVLDAYKFFKFLQLVRFSVPVKLGKLRKSKVSNNTIYSNTYIY